MQTPKTEEVDLYSRFSTTPCEVPETCIVDTNVFLGAGQKISDWSEKQIACSESCKKVIDFVRNRTIDKIVVDSGGEILREYLHNLKTHSGQNQASMVKLIAELIHSRVLYRKITKVADNDYAEFPKDPRLADFDGSDKKFVAVANAEDPRLPILQSMDGKWWKWAKPLHDIGIEVLFTDPVIAQGICSEKYQCSKKKIEECGDCPDNG